MKSFQYLFPLLMLGLNLSTVTVLANSQYLLEVEDEFPDDEDVEYATNTAKNSNTDSPFILNRNLPSTRRPQCYSQQDCPDFLACYTNYQCRDVCTKTSHRLRCGVNAGCRVINHDPVCDCYPGYYGDPKMMCYPFGSGSGSGPGSAEDDGNNLEEGEGCQRHTDCAGNLSCFTDGVCRDPCTNSLHGLDCGRNSACIVVNHQPVCAGSAREDSGEGSDYPNDGSENLVEGECNNHSDCPNNLSCFTDQTCRDTCIYTNHGLNCGKFAVCQVVNHHPVCQAVGSSFGRRK